MKTKMWRGIKLLAFKAADGLQRFTLKKTFQRLFWKFLQHWHFAALYYICGGTTVWLGISNVVNAKKVADHDVELDGRAAPYAGLMLS